MAIILKPNFLKFKPTTPVPENISQNTLQLSSIFSNIIFSMNGRSLFLAPI